MGRVLFVEIFSVADHALTEFDQEASKVKELRTCSLCDAEAVSIN